MLRMTEQECAAMLGVTNLHIKASILTGSALPVHVQRAVDLAWESLLDEYRF